MEKAKSIESIISTELQAVEGEAAELKVTSPGTYRMANALLLQIKVVQGKVNEIFDPQIKKAHDAHRAALDTKRKFMDPLVATERSLKQQMIEYDREQERIAEKERRRLQHEADEKARKERERLEAHAAKLKTEKRRDEILAKAETVVAPVVEVPKATPKASGTTVLITWDPVVEDKAKVPEMFKLVDITALKRLGRTKDQPSDIPGIRWEEKRTMRAG